MEINQKAIQEILRDRDEAKLQMEEANRKLCNMVETFEGKLTDALALGLVRLNFSAPSGFNRYLKALRQGEKRIK